MTKSHRARLANRFEKLVPVARPQVGQTVQWQHTYYLHGMPTTYWRCGKVEIRRGKLWVVVRDRYGHEAKVKASELWEYKPT